MLFLSGDLYTKKINWNKYVEPYNIIKTIPHLFQERLGLWNKYHSTMLAEVIKRHAVSNPIMINHTGTFVINTVCLRFQHGYGVTFHHFLFNVITHPCPNSYTWWRHQMETFSALLAICAGNSPVPGEFPTQRPVTRDFDVYFDLRPNKRLSKQWWGWWFVTQSCPLWRHRNGHTHYFSATTARSF